jgi:hypothetical protein
VHDAVAIAENRRQMLASQRANSLNIREPHWTHLEIDPFVLKRVPDAPREWTGASAFMSDPFEEDQRHGRFQQLPLQSSGDNRLMSRAKDIW